MNTRNYLIIGLIMAAVIFGISTFFGGSIVGWAQGLQARAVASGQGTVGQIVTGPIIFVMQQDIPAAILITLAWPLVFVWLVLVLLLLLLVAGVNVAADIDLQTQLIRSLFV